MSKFRELLGAPRKHPVSVLVTHVLFLVLWIAFPVHDITDGSIELRSGGWASRAFRPVQFYIAATLIAAVAAFAAIRIVQACFALADRGTSETASLPILSTPTPSRSPADQEPCRLEVEQVGRPGLLNTLVTIVARQPISVQEQRLRPDDLHAAKLDEWLLEIEGGERFEVFLPNGVRPKIGDTLALTTVMRDRAFRCHWKKVSTL